MHLDRLPFGVAHHMALLPLASLALLRVRRIRRDPAWWWIAAAFFVSWIADTAAHWVNPDLVGNLYPISQAAIVGYVFLLRRDALIFLTVLLVVGLVTVLWRGPLGIDVLLRTVAWGAVAGIVYDRRALGLLRWALLITFGLGLVCWWGYSIWPGWTSWLTYQAARAAGIALFCAASLNPDPPLHLDSA